MAMISKKNWIFLAAIFIGICLVTSLSAEEVNDMLKQVDKDLREAERDMFSGNTEKAIASLENINLSLQKIKKADPNNAKLKTAENKYNKLVKDLERRTGKSLGGGTVTAAAASTVIQPAPKPETSTGSAANIPATAGAPVAGAASTIEKLPYEARKPVADANKTLNSLQSNLDKLMDPAYGGNKDQLVENIEQKIVLAKESLKEAKNLAAAKGVNSHPDFDEIESNISEAEQNIVTAKSGHEKNKAAAAASANEVDADVAGLKTLYDKVQPVFDKAGGSVFHYNDLKTIEDVIGQIENFEKNDLKAVKTKMQTFAAKYGTTEQEIDKKADAMGYTRVYYKASYPYMELGRGIENVAKTRDVMAEDLVRRTNTELDGISKGAELHVIERYEKVKTWLAMAVRYQADNPLVKDLQNTIDGRIAAGMKEFNTRVDGRTWPGHAPNAPSDAGKLAQVALDWFKNSPDWGKKILKIRRPLAVTVTGPWSVQKRNLLGNPIMYGLPIKLAVLVDEDKELNVARVYELTMRTVEMAGAKMEPPFDHITVGNSYFIRPDKVK